MSEIIIMAVAIAGITGWCMYMDERRKRNGDKGNAERGRGAGAYRGGVSSDSVQYRQENRAGLYIATIERR